MMDASNLLSLDHSDEEFGESDSDNQLSRNHTFGKNVPLSDDEAEDHSSPDEENSAHGSVDDEGNDQLPVVAPEAKVAPLSREDHERKLKELRRTGVVYFSSIPPYMKPVKLRQILSKFGEVNRIFLNPEDAASHARRVKAGGNRKKKYKEGWAEFKRKSQAKLAASTLNGNKIGGKKGSFFYDDILNVKFLKHFKWTDLTEQIALEAQERQERLKAEIAQATRENRIFMENVEKKAMLDRIKSQKGKLKPNAHTKPAVGFQQKPTKTAAKSNAELDRVLSRVF